MSVELLWEHQVISYVSQLLIGLSSLLGDDPSAKEQTMALAKIGELGGTVIYDQTSSKRQVIRISLIAAAIKDGDVHLVGFFPSVRQLDLSFTRISDKGLEQLKNLTRLEILNIDHSKVTGSGLKYLRG